MIGEWEEKMSNDKDQQRKCQDEEKMLHKFLGTNFLQLGGKENMLQGFTASDFSK